MAALAIIKGGDVKKVTKLFTAIAYLNADETVYELSERLKRLTPEQRERWMKLSLALYDQFMEKEDAAYYPDGTPYFAKLEDKGDEGVQPF